MGTTMSCCEVQRTTHKDATRSWTRSCCEVPGTMLCCDTHETSDAGVPCSLQVKNRGESSTTTGRGMNSGRELPTTGRINTGLAMQDAAALNYRKAANEKLNGISRFESRDKGAAKSPTTQMSPRSLQTGGGRLPRLEHRESAYHGARRHSMSPTRRLEKLPLSNQEEMGLGDGLTHELQAAMRHSAARKSELHVHHHQHHHQHHQHRGPPSTPTPRGAEERRKEIQTVYLDENKAASAAGRV